MRDTRIDQMRALTADAQKLVDEMVDEDAATPVDRARLQRVSQYLRFALAASDYWVTKYPDERAHQ